MYMYPFVKIVSLNCAHHSPFINKNRLSSTNHEIITRAYENKLASDSEAIAVQEAISLFAAAPEFHITNKLFSNETGTNNRTVERIINVPTVPNNPPPVTVSTGTRGNNTISRGILLFVFNCLTLILYVFHNF